MDYISTYICIVHQIICTNTRTCLLFKRVVHSYCECFSQWHYPVRILLTNNLLLKVRSTWMGLYFISILMSKSLMTLDVLSYFCHQHWRWQIQILNRRWLSHLPITEIVKKKNNSPGFEPNVFSFIGKLLSHLRFKMNLPEKLRILILSVKTAVFQ